MASKTVLRLGAAIGIVGLTGGAWFAGRQVRSPAEAAATANPPTASRITAPVEERELSSVVLVRGVVRYGDPRSVVLAASTVKAAAANTGATAIVSTPAERGAELAEGATALVVGGRPVFVMQGTVPAYRDLRPGDTGNDVSQLEAGLLRLGISPGPVDGVYDSATERAVEQWYGKKGYSAFGPTESQRTQLRTLRDGLARAQDSVASAERNLEVAGRSSSTDKLASLREAVRSAEERVVTAKAEAASNLKRAENEISAREAALVLAERGVTLAQQSLSKAQRETTDTTPVADANDGVETARSQLRQANAALDDALAQVPIAEAAVTDATAALDQAKKDLESTKKTFTTIARPEVGAIIIEDNSGAIRQAEAAVRGAEATRRQADSNLGAAKRSVDARRAAIVDAERAVTRAESAVGRAKQSVSDRAGNVEEVDQRLATAIVDRDRAKRDLDAAVGSRRDTMRAGALAVRQATGGVDVARAQLRDALGSGDLRLSRQQLSSAIESEKRATTELNDYARQVGVVVPANEVLFFPSLPLRVDEVKALRGDVVNGPVMTVTTARLAVDSSVDVSEAKLVKVGAVATIESAEFNVVLPGRVTEIATTAGTKGVDPGKVYLEVTPDEGAGTDVDPKQLNGSSVKLTIPIRSTGKAVLSVPVAAVSVAADGTSRVEIEDDPKQPTRFLSVRTGLSAEGFVEVTPVNGSLKAGDQVVVGNRDAATIEGAVEANDESSDTLAPPDSSASEPDTAGTETTEVTSDSEATSESGATSDSEATSDTEAPA